MSSPNASASPYDSAGQARIHFPIFHQRRHIVEGCNAQRERAIGGPDVDDSAYNRVYSLPVTLPQLRYLYTSTDGKFNLYDIYWMVVDAIEFGDGDFKKGLINYWNSELFGSAQGLAPAVVFRQLSEEGGNAKKNSANRFLAQREAKAAKKAAAAAIAIAGSTSGSD
ncbi:hypothetical protein SCHPADRAFT_946427 [Schizopora paradoxa]|uniref:Uncharacterized protein n=1 Tax=Schizopora paradoxa TaxID=27342 RepID=A0A0H2R3X4_9AGAM|nr:hypothetical protein SCHPADRAFT_946427 [Schizopora paradoxa]